MVAPSDDQPGIRQSFVHELKGFNHQLKPFVGSPFAESQNAMFKIAPAREIGILRCASQNAVRANVHIVAAVFFVKNFAITRHENRHRIGEQKHSGGDGAGRAINRRMPHSCIFQIYRIH